MGGTLGLKLNRLCVGVHRKKVVMATHAHAYARTHARARTHTQGSKLTAGRMFS